MRHFAIFCAFLLVLAAALTAGCGKDDPAPSVGEAADVAAAEKPPEHPKDEAALVERFTVSMEKRDILALKTLVSAELGAELHRWYSKDAEAFWGRGQRWIDNVRSGVEIAFKQEARDDRWRALLKFANGEEETVIFTRVDGKLLIAEL